MDKFFVSIDNSGKITSATASYNVNLEKFKPSIDCPIEVNEQIFNNQLGYIYVNGQFQEV